MQVENEEQEKVKEMVLRHPTYGYRRVYVELNKKVSLGKERVRHLMALLGLQRETPRKKRRESPKVTPTCDLPAGRKVQIDATRLSLEDGVGWVYLVEDVASRACLAAKVVRSLSKELAAEALREAQIALGSLGISEPLVVQSDAGSDFTSGHFQSLCTEFGCWVRSRINQSGGMGILERLNKTFKHDFIFRHELDTLMELKKIVPKFRRWYNQERIHSSVGYKTPWQVLEKQATLA
jgi:transposase InsO family protein